MSYILISLFLLISIGLAQSISVEADSLVYESDRMIYKGNAVLKKGRGTLKADKIVIFIGSNGKAEKIVAEGNAVYTEDSRRATAEEIIQDMNKNVIILKGNARIEEGKNFIEAEEIIYYVDSGKAVARGMGRRVKTFYAEEVGDEKAGDSE